MDEWTLIRWDAWAAVGNVHSNKQIIQGPLEQLRG